MYKLTDKGIEKAKHYITCSTTRNVSLNHPTDIEERNK